MGQNIGRAGNGATGTKKIIVHYGLESPWACKGPKDTKASYGPKDVVGRK